GHGPIEPGPAGVSLPGDDLREGLRRVFRLPLLQGQDAVDFKLPIRDGASASCRGRTLVLLRLGDSPEASGDEGAHAVWPRGLRLGVDQLRGVREGAPLQIAPGPRV